MERNISKLMAMLEIGGYFLSCRGKVAMNLQTSFLHRKNLTAWANGDDLVLAVAAQNNNTIVVVHSVGPLIVEPWIDNPNVTAVRFSSCLFLNIYVLCC